MNYELLNIKQEQIAKNFEYVGRRGIFYISMRFGKTKTAFMTIKPGQKVLVAYPIVSIKASWLETAKRFHFEHLLPNITFTTFKSIKKHIGKDFDMIIIDEPQKLSANNRRDLAAIGAETKPCLALTGSLNFKTKKALQEDLNLNIISEYTIDEAIADKIVRDYSLIIHELDLNTSSKSYPYEKFFKSMMGTEKEVYDYYTSQMDYWEEKRVEALAVNDIAGHGKASAVFKKFMGLRTNFLYNAKTLLHEADRFLLMHADKKVLIFTMRTSIADSLSSDVYHSKNMDDEVLDNFKISEGGHLSTVNMVAEGITILDLDIILFHTTTSNPENFIQKLARGLQMTESTAGKPCEIHILCLKDTVQKQWIESACDLLNPNKIYYQLENGELESRIARLKRIHPEREYYFYGNSICYYNEVDQESGKPNFKFLSGDKTYLLPLHKLVPFPN